MTIQYSNGRSFEATLLSRSEHSMRVIIQGFNDVLEFTLTDGVWVTEDWEQVQVEFAYRPGNTFQTTEEDCICSHELAARLMQLLFTGENKRRVASVSN